MPERRFADHNYIPFIELLSTIIDNRGRSCPTTDTGIPLIATNCIRNDNLYPSFDKVRYVSSETYDSWFRGHPEPGDIIFVCKGTPGRVCMTPTPVNFCIAQDMVAVRPDKEIIYPRYLLAALRSPSTQEQISNLHVGTLIPHFKKGDFDKLLIPLPGRRDQEAIGDIYYFLSEKIAINDRIATVSQRLTSALLERMLGDGGNGNHVLLGEVAAVNTLKVKPKSGGFLRYIDISSVSVDRFEWPDRISWADAPGRARRGVRPGDTIWSTVRPGRRSRALILDDDPELVVSTGFAVLTPQKIGPSFLYEVTRRDEFTQYLESVAEGSAYPAVRAERFEKAPIPLLSDGHMEQFESNAIQLYRRVHAAARESRTLAELRDTLLPKLMSGEIRVRDAEKAVEEAT